MVDMLEKEYREANLYYWPSRESKIQQAIGDIDDMRMPVMGSAMKIRWQERYPLSSTFDGSQKRYAEINRHLVEVYLWGYDLAGERGMADAVAHLINAAGNPLEMVFSSGSTRPQLEEILGGKLENVPPEPPQIAVRWKCE